MSSHTVYSSLEELRAVIGVQTGAEERLGLAVICGSAWVRQKLGIGDPGLEPAPEPPYTLTVEPSSPQVRSIANLAAVRFYRSPDVSLGVAGGMGDLAVRISSMQIPDLELQLLGMRQSWGIA